MKRFLDSSAKSSFNLERFSPWLLPIFKHELILIELRIQYFRSMISRNSVLYSSKRGENGTTQKYKCVNTSYG